VRVIAITVINYRNTFASGISPCSVMMRWFPPTTLKTNEASFFLPNLGVHITVILAVFPGGIAPLSGLHVKDVPERQKGKMRVRGREEGWK
jgi:hypothetical protein